ncbi:MAG: SUF system NifU family Fe-S cluster assembly protein [Acidimicrobiia bacterium]|nr:SUF system NifU family Fe-S cluster assembly protein [Acidimicrobiia bacterium]
MPGLEDLYKEIILDHYRNPRNRGELPPPACKAEGFNPLCGDEIVVTLTLDENEVIQDIAIGGQGCSISQSSASMMSAAVKGKSVTEVRELTDQFKTMMSINEAPSGSQAENDADQIAAAKAAAGAGDAGTIAGAAEKPDLSMGDLSALRGVVKFPVRIKCAVLSWNTLMQALEEAGV